MKKALIILPIMVIAVGCKSIIDPLLLSSSGNNSIGHTNQSYLGSQVITKTPENDAIVASQDGLVGAQIGSSSRYYILGMGFGGGTVADAAMNGAIRQVTTVERQRAWSLWPIFWKTKTVITGDGPRAVLQPGSWNVNRSTRFYHHLSPTTPAPTPPTTPATP